MENVAKCLLVNRIKLLVFLLLFVVVFSCRQTNISKCQAKRIGMDTLCQIYDKEELKELKSFELVETDSTWILRRKGKKSDKYRTFGGIINVFIDKNNGKVIKIKVLK